ncbi:MAG TPA: phosphate uptake regulator PhoU, partial [Campylobacterales bacterium]|nr:phosphate uptake regulator PhoU [Campylobacterales bacterium]
MLENYKQILEKSRTRVLALANDVLTAYGMSIEAFENSDIEKASEARALLKDAHDRNNKIDNEIIKTLALFSPEARDLRVVIAHLKIASELTRISDYVRNYAKNVKMGISGDFELEGLKEDTLSFNQSTYKSLKEAVDAVEEESEDVLENIYRIVNVEVSKCDDIYSILEQ